MSDFRLVCRFAKNTDISKVESILEKRAKEANIKLEKATEGGLTSFRIFYDDIEETLSMDSYFFAIETYGQYGSAYSAKVRPNFLNWILDADLAPGTEKPFSYHDSEPYFIKEDKLDEIRPFLDTDRLVFLPIVYLPFGVIKDVNALQKALKGQAHIVAEPDAYTNGIMIDEWLIDPPDRDSCRIIFPRGISSDISLKSFLDEEERANVIFFAIQEVMRKDNRFSYLSWPFIADEDEEEAVDDNDIPILEEPKEILDPTEHDVDDLLELVSKLNDELKSEREAKYKAQRDVSRWKELYESRPREGRINIECNEKDLYLGEVHDAILYLIDSRLKEIESGEREFEKLRYYTILKSLQESNSKVGEGDKLKKDLEKTILETSAPNLKAKMEKLGFEDITSSGHLRFNFCSDPRYTLVLASTPSDRAGRKNAGSNKVMKSFFPF